MEIEQILEQIKHFNFTKVSFLLNSQDPFFISRFIGSTLRGGFGFAFKNVICFSRLKKECTICYIVESCPYSLIFEGIQKKGMSSVVKETPKPFIIDIPSVKKNSQETNLFEFNLIIIGNAVSFFPYFFLAFSVLGEKGLGLKKSRFNIEKVEQLFPSRKLIYRYGDEELGKLEKSNIKFVASSEKVKSLTVEFLSPVKIKYNGELISVIEFHHLIRALLRRISFLSSCWCDYDMQMDWTGLIEESQNIRIARCELKWRDFIRYSSRQKQTMKLGGVLGSVEYKGDLNKFLPLLKLGEFIHVGKNTTFGFGKYSLKY